MKQATGAVKKKDDLWAELVKERDDWTCQYPGCERYFPEGSRQGLHAHHGVAGRTARSVRWRLEQGVSLCFGHHMIAHQRPLDFADFMRERLGSEQYDEIRRLSKVTKASKGGAEAVAVAKQGTPRATRRAHP